MNVAGEKRRLLCRFFNGLAAQTFVLLLVQATIQPFQLSARSNGQKATGSNSDIPKLVPQTGHTRAVTKVLFCKNDSLIISASLDNTVKIWDVATSSELRSLVGHTAPVRAIAATKDSARIASSGIDRKIKIWDLTTGELISETEDKSSVIESLAFSPDGKFLAAGGADSKIHILDGTSGKLLSELTGHIGGVNTLEFSPNGSQLASGGADSTVLLWQLSNGKKPRIVFTHNAPVTALAFSIGGEILVSGSMNGSIQISSLDHKGRNHSVNRHKVAIKNIHFNRENRLLAFDTGSDFSEWDLEKGEVSRSFAIASGGNSASSAAISNSGELLAANYGDRVIAIARLSDGKVSGSLQGMVPGYFSLAVNDEKSLLAVGANDRTAKLFDLSTGQLRFVFPHDGTVSDLEFSGDNRYLITGSVDNKVRIWDVSTGSLFKVLDSHKASITEICMIGTRFASGDTNGTIMLWEFGSLDSPVILTEHKKEIIGLDFLGDGARLASASIDGSIRSWSISDAGQTSKVVMHGSGMRDLSVDPSGETAYVATDLGVIELELATGNQRTSVDERRASALAVSRTNAETLIVTGNSLGTLRSARITKPTELSQKDAHFGNIHALQFSKSGEWLFSAGDDGTVNIWRADSLDLIASLSALRESQDWLVATPEGLMDGTPKAWKSISWRFGKSTFEVGSVETFFNEFFRPGLLADVFRNDGGPIFANRTLAKIDRRQPVVEIASDAPKIDQIGSVARASYKSQSREVSITVNITESNESLTSIESGGSSGARDVRLFRNGSLIKKWSGNIFSKESGCEQVETKGNERRKAICRTRVVISAGDNLFTAYAFNRENVKSKDAETVIVGSESLKRKGTLYVLAVGVDKYAASDRTTGQPHDLRFAVADINRIGREIETRQNAIGKYAATKVIRLADEYATKANVLLALRRFSTDQDTSHLSESIRIELSKISITGPEDAILFHFSGHGTARCSINSSKQKDCDRFYLVPHDGFPSQPTDSEGFNKALFAASISDQELESHFETIVAGNLLMVIDACNSGQALEADEKRRGPMNSLGLAQLAYEKGMMILTASQSQQAALETNRLGHGLLTYALIEGLTKAVSSPGKGIIDRSWFNYALAEVPNLQFQSMKQRDADIQSGIKGPKIYFVPGADSNLPPEKRGLQSPRIFYRLEADANPLVVARP